MRAPARRSTVRAGVRLPTGIPRAEDGSPSRPLPHRAKVTWAQFTLAGDARRIHRDAVVESKASATVRARRAAKDDGRVAASSRGRPTAPGDTLSPTRQGVGAMRLEGPASNRACVGTDLASASSKRERTCRSPSCLRLSARASVAAGWIGHERPGRLSTRFQRGFRRQAVACTTHRRSTRARACGECTTDAPMTRSGIEVARGRCDRAAEPVEGPAGGSASSVGASWT